MNILVVDDDAKIRELLTIMLETEGHKVMEAESGLDAMDICNNKDVDVLITDIIMPKKGGMRTIIEVKNSYPNVSVIAISGGGYLDSSEYLEYAKKVGANATLEKPFKKQQLISLIEKVSNK